MKFNKKNIFLILYWLGIGLATMVVFSGAQKVVIGHKYFPDVSRYIFMIAILHMIAIIILGFMLKENKTLAGVKIQTAGYLHTLIGFSSALLHVNVENFVLGQIMLPLGSALITSILGWFFGGELITDWKEGKASFSDELDSVATELGSFNKAIKKVHREYTDTFNSIAKQHLEVSATQTKIINDADSGLTKLITETEKVKEKMVAWSSAMSDIIDAIHSSVSNDIVTSSENVNKNAKKLSAALQESTHASNDVAKYLYQSKTLVQEMEKLLDYISTLKRDTYSTEPEGA